MCGATECPFCTIASGNAPASIVYQDAYTVAFLPLNPATWGHTLVIPRKHVDDFLHLDVSAASELSKSVLRVAAAVREAVQPAGLNLITSAGKAAQQSVFHLHVHVLPRFVGDRVGEIWPEDEPMSASDRDSLQSSISDAVTGVIGSPPPQR